MNVMGKILILLTGVVFGVMVCQVLGRTYSDSTANNNDKCLEEYKVAYEEAIIAMNQAYSTLEQLNEADQYYELIQGLRIASRRVDDRELVNKISIECSR